MDIIFSAFDIETTPFSMFTPEINFIGLHNELTEIYFDRSDEFINYCFPKLVENSYLHIIVAFNINFDYGIIFNDYFHRKKVLPNNWQAQNINITSKAPHFALFEIKKVKKVKYSTGKKTTLTYINRVVFLDVANFFGGIHYKLEFLMKIFTPELIQAKKTGDFGLERNKADIIATLRIYKEFFQTYEKNKTLFPYYSISAISFRELLDLSQYKWLQKQPGERLAWLVKIERQSYKGGIVYPNPKYLLQKQDEVAYFDINSLYPFIMRELKVAYELIGRFNYYLAGYKAVKKVVNSFYKNNNQFVLLHLRFELKYPLIPVKKQGKLELVCNELVSDWICENELYPALNRSDNPFTTIEILEIISYKANKGQFASYIDKYSDIKENCSKTIDYYHKTYQALESYFDSDSAFELSDILNKVEEKEYLQAQIGRMQAKLKMNTCYGKLGQIKLLTRQFFVDEKIFPILQENQPDYYFDERQQIMFKMRYEFGFIYGESEDSESEKLSAVTIVASSITAGARGYIMSCYNPDSTIYIDTDSLTTKKDLFPYPDKINNKLGGWKIEKEGEIIVFGKKWYKFNDKLKIKGIPKKALQIDDYNFTFYRLCRFRESQVRKLPLFSSILVKKELSQNIKLDLDEKVIKKKAKINYRIDQDIIKQINKERIFDKII